LTKKKVLAPGGREVDEVGGTQRSRGKKNVLDLKKKLTRFINSFISFPLHEQTNF
jgi:hypothetical protein